MPCRPNIVSFHLISFHNCGTEWSARRKLITGCYYYTCRIFIEYTHQQSADVGSNLLLSLPLAGLLQFHDSSTSSSWQACRSTLKSRSFSRRLGSRDRVTRLRNLSIPLANKTRGSSLISMVFTGQPADVTRARLFIASHRRCIMRVWLHIPRRVREQKGWNAPALSFLSSRVERILINGGETLRHSAAARAAEMN